VIGRCHAALGEHALSVSAIDAAVVLARCGHFLLSEALAIRDRALLGQGAGGSRLHWDEAAGTQRLMEVAGRMQGPREPLGQLLGVCLTAQCMSRKQAYRAFSTKGGVVCCIHRHS
jgi:hypothetical protein